MADPTIADFAPVDSAENQLNRFKMKKWVCGYGGNADGGREKLRHRNIWRWLRKRQTERERNRKSDRREK